MYCTRAKLDDKRYSYRDGYLKTSPDSEEQIASEAKKKGMSVDEYSKWEFNRADLNRNGKVTAHQNKSHFFHIFFRNTSNIKL